jgi:hypothetical protein
VDPVYLCQNPGDFYYCHTVDTLTSHAHYPIKTAVRTLNRDLIIYAVGNESN